MKNAISMPASEGNPALSGPRKIHPEHSQPHSVETSQVERSRPKDMPHRHRRWPLLDFHLEQPAKEARAMLVPEELNWDDAGG